MLRSLAERPCALLCLALLSGAASGCTLFAGEPWGEVALTLSVTMAPPDARLSADGALKTANDYAIEMDEVWLDVDVVSLSVSGEDERLSFDPARPPPGYSLCHGGHCHADDGRLVEYAEIERSLGQEARGQALVLDVTSDVVALSDEPTPLSLAACEERCWLERGSLSSLGVAMSELIVRGTVSDLRSGDDARLPPEGVPLEAIVARPFTASRSLALPVDGSEPAGLSLAAVLTLSPSLFDGVDFGSLSRDGTEPLRLDEAAVAVVIEQLADSEIDVRATRTSLARPFTPVFLPADPTSETP